MVGQCLLKYVHPRDLPKFVDIFQQIHNSPNKIIQSPHYSFMAYNGEYITITTEWTSYTNPWNNEFEYILGKNIVVK